MIIRKMNQIAFEQHLSQLLYYFMDGQTFKLKVHYKEDSKDEMAHDFVEIHYGNGSTYRINTEGNSTKETIKDVIWDINKSFPK